MPKNKVYDKNTPWDLLLQTIKGLEHHADVMDQLINVHNTQQAQVNRLKTDVHNLNKRLTMLERRLNEIG